MIVFVLLCCVSVSYGLLGVGSEQSIAVRGKLLCNGVPAGAVKLKLYDVNTLETDNFMDEEFSDPSGVFYLSGTEKDLTKMDPKLNIYHKCNYDGLCYQKIAINIPKHYISSGRMPDKVFDAGEIELAGRFSGQTTDCLN